MTRKKASVDAITHDDTRKNIPTEELRDFVMDDETAPKTVLYPRDPSLDPQLVWKGKDEQDAEDLSVPSVPIYIQEKVHPQAIIENFLADVRRGSAGASGEGETFSYQAQLFDDFNGLPEAFDDKVDFYKHDGHWSNRMILGDSLLVMNSLADKEGLKGKVQTIYFDPPYAIKFGSNWQVSTRKKNLSNTKTEDVTREPEQVKAYRDTWELGIHSFLPYIRDRLKIAQELLTESGSCFVQISDANVHLVRCVMDEVFGSENFVSLITFRKKTMPLGAKYLESIGDYIIHYAKNIKNLKFRHLYLEMKVEGDTHWDSIEESSGRRRKMSDAEIKSHDLLPPECNIYQLISLYPAGLNKSGLFSVPFNGKSYSPKPGSSYFTNPIGMKRLLAANRIEAYEDGQTIRYVLKLVDNPLSPLTNFWTDTSAPTGKIYVVQTSNKVIQRCLLMTTDPGDLVLDPTCGSGTTAYVAEQWGRRWITIDTSRVALALARTRLMAARYPYYLLADSDLGRAKEGEVTGVQLPDGPSGDDVRQGFVYKHIPYIERKSITTNEEIDDIHDRWQVTLESLLAKINAVSDTTWEDWEIPLTHDDPAVAILLEQWWAMCRSRQEEIDTSIARRAVTKYLYDQPYEDKKRVRVAGPFTVESLSPHRVLPADADQDGVVTPKESERQQDFTTIILENLHRAGVQNTKKGERLKFDTLDPYPGTWLQAAGTFREADGTEKRVAVSIGPEHGTVGPEQVKEAAKEAVQGLGFDLLIVCGFAFDPHTGEEAKRMGKLTVLPTRMNPDLAMGGDLLKKTGSGNLFMVFGEPDLEVLEQPDGMIAVRLRGVDVYDPTTGDVRSSDGTKDIACWFIDTDYDSESFFVRHAYFTGADQPYDKLKRALRAEVDEGAWATLYRNESRPFPRPKRGQIAVKVINHYGDEVLKVFGV